MNQAQTNVGKSLDVQSFINQQPLSRYQWRVVLLCFLIVFLDGLDTAAMGFIAPALSQDWGIDRASLGPVMSAALIGMVFGALGSGPLADRFGRKVVLVGAVLLFGAFSLASAYSTNVDQLLVLRFLTGLGLGGAMPNSQGVTLSLAKLNQIENLSISRFTSIYYRKLKYKFQSN